MRHTVFFCVLLMSAAGCDQQRSSTLRPQPNDARPSQSNKQVDSSADRSTNRSITLQTLTYDDTLKLIESYRGRVVVVDVWSSTCLPCLKEFPGLVKMHHAYSRDDLMCVSLNIDFLGIQGTTPDEEDRPTVLKHLQRFEATFDNILCADDADTMLDRLQLAAPPAVYVYARDGKLAKRFDNQSLQSEDDAFTYQDVGRLVAELVAQDGRQ